MRNVVIAGLLVLSAANAHAASAEVAVLAGCEGESCTLTRPDGSAVKVDRGDIPPKAAQGDVLVRQKPWKVDRRATDAVRAFSRKGGK